MSELRFDSLWGDRNREALNDDLLLTGPCTYRDGKAVCAIRFMFGYYLLQYLFDGMSIQFSFVREGEAKRCSCIVRWEGEFAFIISIVSNVDDNLL